eukprot:356329-Chlamydomonas_euryale.AAC.2
MDAAAHGGQIAAPVAFVRAAAEEWAARVALAKPTTAPTVVPTSTGPMLRDVHAAAGRGSTANQPSSGHRAGAYQGGASGGSNAAEGATCAGGDAAEGAAAGASMDRAASAAGAGSADAEGAEEAHTATRADLRHAACTPATEARASSAVCIHIGPPEAELAWQGDILPHRAEWPPAGCMEVVAERMGDFKFKVGRAHAVCLLVCLFE